MTNMRGKRTGAEQKGDTGAESVTVGELTNKQVSYCTKECALCQYVLLLLPSDPSTVRTL